MNKIMHEDGGVEDQLRALAEDSQNDGHTPMMARIDFEYAVTDAPSEFTASGTTYQQMSPDAQEAIDRWLQQIGVMPATVEIEGYDSPASNTDEELDGDEYDEYDDEYDDAEEYGPSKLYSTKYGRLMTVAALDAYRASDPAATHYSRREDYFAAEHQISTSDLYAAEAEDRGESDQGYNDDEHGETDLAGGDALEKYELSDEDDDQPYDDSEEDEIDELERQREWESLRDALRSELQGESILTRKAIEEWAEDLFHLELDGPIAQYLGSPLPSLQIQGAAGLLKDAIDIAEIEGRPVSTSEKEEARHALITAAEAQRQSIYPRQAASIETLAENVDLLVRLIAIFG